MSRRRPHRFLAAALAMALLMAGPGLAAADWPAPGDASMRAIAALPEYEAREQVAGTVRLWGHGSFKHDFMRRMIERWIVEFNRHHPQVEFEYLMYGTASAVGAIYTDAGDIAILGEEISPAAARAFRRARGYPHTDITIATGSVDVNFFDYAHMVFVHRDNPIERLDLQQLDAIFGAQHLRGSGNIRSWGQLGLGSEWAAARITPHAWKTDVDFALFFRDRVLMNSHRWNPDTREYVHQRSDDGNQYDHGQRILDALAEDRFGIAISNTRYARPEVKVVALAWEPGGAWTLPDQASLIDQRYPLTRLIPAIVDKPPGERLKPAVQAFLDFILSRDGQQILATHSGYLPVSPEVAARQRETLE